MKDFDLELISTNFSNLIDKFLTEIQLENRGRLILLVNKIIQLEYFRQKEGLEDIYFPKRKVCKELKCSLRTLDADLNIFINEGFLTKRLGTYFDGRRSIGNSLFIKIRNIDVPFIKRIGIKESLMMGLNLLKI